MRASPSDWLPKQETLAHDDGWPEIVEIEPTQDCNLRCVMCHVPYNQAISRTFISIDWLKPMSFIRDKWVILGGSCEPMVHPQFDLLARLLHDAGAKIELTTNGTLFTESMLRKLENISFAYVTISFDGVTKEVFEKIRRGADYDAALAGIRAFRRQLGNLNTYWAINYVVTDSSIADIADAVAFWDAEGFDHIGFIPMQSWANHPDVAAELPAGREEDIARQIRVAAEHIRAKRTRISMSSPYLANAGWPETFVRSDNPDSMPPFNIRPYVLNGHHPLVQVPCRAPYKYVQIDARGEVRLCQRFLVGNISEQPLEDIWRNGTAQSVRHLIHRDAKTCTFCDYYNSCIKANHLREDSAAPRPADLCAEAIDYAKTNTGRPIPRRIAERSFFRLSRSSGPYYIFAPDYRHSAAGIRCLHQLCHALNVLGEDAYLVPAKVTHPGLRTPPLTPEIVKKHFLDGLVPIAVYPEIISGNPFDLPLAVRWLLNKPGHLAGNADTWSPTDPVFYFQEWCKPEGMRGTRLEIPTIDSDVFNNRDNPDDSHRQGACYYANKYLAFGGEIDEEMKRNATSLCLDVLRSPEELAAILRKSEVLYCYEASSIIVEALACGCPVLIVPSAYWYEHGGNTVFGNSVRLATEPDALRKAQAEMFDREPLMAAACEESWRQVERFVDRTTDARLLLRGRQQVPDAKALLDDPRLFWMVPGHVRSKLLDSFLASLDRSKMFPEGIGDSARPPNARANQEMPVLGQPELALFQARIPEWAAHPVFHLVIIDDDVSDAALARTLQSLDKQQYSRVIATVVSTHHPAPPDLGKGPLEWWQTQGDPRLLVNEAIAQSPADWCGVMRAGDALMPHAFLVFGEFLNTRPSCNALYSDEAIADAARGIDVPDMRPDFDLDRLRTDGYIRGLILARRGIWSAIGGWLALPRGLDELDAALRLAEACGKDAFGHVPGVLYRRDASAYVPSLEAAAQDLRRQIVQEHLARQHVAAVAEDGLLPGTVRVRYALERPPLISVIVPTRNRAAALEACLNSLVEVTQYPELEILVVDHGSDDPTTRAYLDGLAQLGNERIRVLRNDEPFNLARLVNLAAAAATGELLLLLHDDVCAAHPDWLHNMASLCMRQDVAAVGARLLQRDGTLQQGWLTPIKAGLVPPAFQGWPLDAPDSQRPLNVEQGASAVGSACMLVKKSAFFAVGGMDAEDFPDYFADIDFCLRLRAAGHNIAWTPYATLVHDSDNSTWGDRSASEALVRKWGKVLARDPFLNPYIAVGGSGLEPETDPVFLPDVITWHPVPNILAMASDLDGSGHYRIVQPARSAMEASLVRSRVSRGYPALALMEKLEVDTVYSQRQLEDIQIENLKRYREVLGCRIVMDFDDLVTHVPEKNAHKKSLFKDMKNRLRQVAAVADRLTVSTTPLADHFSEYHGDIRIVPNALMRSQWEHLNSKRGTSKKFRVGWAGGISHRGDLEVVRDAVRELADEVEWVFLGMQLEDCVPYVKEFHKGVAFPAYAEKLASLNLDLAIAPLEIHPFNECKSHLRLLEYGILGIPVIATDIHPYRSGFPVTLVKNKHKDWVRAIRDHINDRDAMYRKGDELRQYILDRWMLDQHLAEWLAAWS